MVQQLQMATIDLTNENILTLNSELIGELLGQSIIIKSLNIIDGSLVIIYTNVIDTVCGIEMGAKGCENEGYTIGYTGISATGMGAFATGGETTNAKGDYSLAMGNGCQAIDDYSVSIGVNNITNGNGGVTIGDNNDISIEQAIFDKGLKGGDGGYNHIFGSKNSIYGSAGGNIAMGVKNHIYQNDTKTYIDKGGTVQSGSWESAAIGWLNVIGTQGKGGDLVDKGDTTYACNAIGDRNRISLSSFHTNTLGSINEAQYGSNSTAVGTSNRIYGYKGSTENSTFGYNNLINTSTNNKYNIDKGIVEETVKQNIICGNNNTCYDSNLSTIVGNVNNTRRLSESTVIGNNNVLSNTLINSSLYGNSYKGTSTLINNTIIYQDGTTEAGIHLKLRATEGTKGGGDLITEPIVCKMVPNNIIPSGGYEPADYPYINGYYFTNKLNILWGPYYFQPNNAEGTGTFLSNGAKAQ